MIKLVENNKEAALVLEHLRLDPAPLLAAKMFTEGFGVNQDFLKFYAAFNYSGKLCGAFVTCNDRVFCLLEKIYDKEEILFFLSGFSDFKIFISAKFSHIIERTKFNKCLLMKKSGKAEKYSSSIQEIESKFFTSIIMKDKEKDTYIRFFLNNSHLQRHGYLKNFALTQGEEVLSVASLYNDKEKSYLCNVFTPENHRHKGYSSALISEITNTITEYHLICSEDVFPLYNKCGFSSYAQWIEFLY